MGKKLTWGVQLFLLESRPIVKVLYNKINQTYSNAIDNRPAPKQNAVKKRTAVEKLKKKVISVYRINH